MSYYDRRMNFLQLGRLLDEAPYDNDLDFR